MNYKSFDIKRNPEITASLEAIDYIYRCLEDAYGSTYSGVDQKTLLTLSVEIFEKLGEFEYGDPDVQ